ICCSVCSIWPVPKPRASVIALVSLVISPVSRVFMNSGALLRCMVVTMAVAATCLCDGIGLLEAVRTRDHKALEAIIKSHANVNVAQPEGATVLAWAVFIDDREAAEMLLAAGARVDTADEYGETPLTLACGTGNVGLVKRLLDAGATANAARWD